MIDIQNTVLFGTDTLAGEGVECLSFGRLGTSEEELQQTVLRFYYPVCTRYVWLFVLSLKTGSLWRARRDCYCWLFLMRGERSWGRVVKSNKANDVNSETKYMARMWLKRAKKEEDGKIFWKGSVMAVLPCH